VVFRTRVDVGTDVTARDLQRDFDAVLLAGGAGKARDLDVPGRTLGGVHFAMEYLTQQNRRCQGDAVPDETSISAAGKHVIIIGGGDTGADCLGTVHRQRAASVTQLELLPRPPLDRPADNPWPLWPNIFRTSSAHEEGGERVYAVETTELVDDGTGTVRALRGRRVERLVAKDGVRLEAVPDSAFELKADLVLLAMGFVGPEKSRLLDDLGITMSPRGTVGTNGNYQTNVPGVFAAGDMQRGQSLIVWAIDDGRRAAQAIDAYLMSA
jgi:glutamate synthase (NADPH/NADH) small chain